MPIKPVMEKKEEDKKTCSHPNMVAVLVLCIILILTLMCCVGYGAVYITRHIESQNLMISNLQERLAELEAVEKTRNQNNLKRDKREVISSSKVDLSSVLRGPVGPPGPSERDGRDGKDFASLDLLRGIINETVVKEWSTISASLPTYGGSTYIRWGKKSCPSDSKIIYEGQMTGPSFRSAGGGPNWQCLPDDPEYSQKAPTASHSSLRASQNKGGKQYNHRIPCAACETNQRLTQIMIPAKVRCPSSDWSLDYKGYLFSAAEYELHPDNDLFKTNYFRGNYVCIDESTESLTSQPYPSHDGNLLYLVMTRCDGNGALHNCPPFQDRKALSCVVCSK